jgi:hypothetical protein
MKCPSGVFMEGFFVFYQQQQYLGTALAKVLSNHRKCGFQRKKIMGNVINGAPENKPQRPNLWRRDASRDYRSHEEVISECDRKLTTHTEVLNRNSTH